MKPEIINGLFALSGALIGVAGSWFVTRSNKEKKHLTLFVSPCAKLLDVGEIAKSEVKILYKDEPVEDLGAGEVTIQNTGTTAVEGIELEMLPIDGSPVMDFEVGSANFQLPKDFVTINKYSSGGYKSEIMYLNPKDRIVFSYRIAGKEKPDFSVRKQGLDVSFKQEAVNWIPDIYADMFFEMFDRMPGYSLLFALMNKNFRLYRESKRKNA